jgi:GT2 family glycosyltransferase
MSNRPSKPKARRDDVVLAHIHPGQVSAYFNQSLCGLLMYDRAHAQRIVGSLQEWSSANISQPRNNLTRTFLEDFTADWLLWIDSDMAFSPDALEGLLKVADPDRAPIVGGLCFGSDNDRMFPTIYQMATLEDGRPVTMRVHEYPQNAMVQVASTGAAFVLIHRSVLVTIRDRAFNKVFPWFQETELAGHPCGEDLTFCLRAGICDFPVWVNTAVKIGHHKSHLLTEDLFLSQRTSEAV